MFRIVCEAFGLGLQGIFVDPSAEAFFIVEQKIADRFPSAGQQVFNSEQLEALRHHFPNISKAMEEGKDLLKQITRSRGFGMGM